MWRCSCGEGARDVAGAVVSVAPLGWRMAICSLPWYGGQSACSVCWRPQCRADTLRQFFPFRFFFPYSFFFVHLREPPLRYFRRPLLPSFSVRVSFIYFYLAQTLTWLLLLQFSIINKVHYSLVIPRPFATALLGSTRIWSEKSWKQVSELGSVCVCVLCFSSGAIATWVCIDGITYRLSIILPGIPPPPPFICTVTLLPAFSSSDNSSTLAICSCFFPPPTHPLLLLSNPYNSPERSLFLTIRVNWDMQILDANAGLIVPIGYLEPSCWSGLFCHLNSSLAI